MQKKKVYCNGIILKLVLEENFAQLTSNEITKEFIQFRVPETIRNADKVFIFFLGFFRFGPRRSCYFKKKTPNENN